MKEIPQETLYTLATCHTLMNLDEELIGDPLEKVTLQTIEWSLTKGDVVISKKPKLLSEGISNKSVGWKIYQRFYFSSALKRMSVIAGHTKPGSSDTNYIATCKGAPEVLKSMVKKKNLKILLNFIKFKIFKIKELPTNFDSIYLHYAREGARVLCLGYKDLGVLSHQEIRELNREKIENNLNFAGFVVFSSPLKPDSKNVIKEIMNASHHITMITGDNPLTACHVASKLRLIDKKKTFVLEKEENSSHHWSWKSILDDNQTKKIEFAANQSQKYLNPSKLKDLPNVSYSYLCLTGEV